MKKMIFLCLCFQTIFAADRAHKTAIASWLAEEVAAINAAFEPIQSHHQTLLCAAPSKAIKASATAVKIVVHAKVYNKSKEYR
jgi:hypothetical protein